jgi:hypothetical protein
MFTYHQQALQALNILNAPYQKIINDYNASGILTNEVIHAMSALKIYNSFKQKYQPSV